MVNQYQACPGRIWGIVLLALVYYAAGQLGLLFSIPEIDVSAVWPASGLALAGLLLFGWRIWPGIWLGSFAIEVVVFYHTHALSALTILWIAALVATGSSLEALIGFFLLNRRRSRLDGGCWRGPLFSKIGVFHFTAVTMGICLVAALIGSTAFCALGAAQWEHYPMLLSTWWLGDVSCILILTPATLAWSQMPRMGWPMRVWGEAILVFGLLILVCWISFSPLFTIEGRAMPLLFLTIVPLAWIAVRLGARATALALLVSAVTTTRETLHHFGPLVLENRQTSLLLLISYLAVVAITIFVLENDSTARRQAEALIVGLNENLEERVKERTAELERTNAALRESKERFALLVSGVQDYAIFALDPDGRVVSWNAGAERIKGYRVEEILGRHFSCFYPPEDIQSGKPERELKIAAAKGRFEDEGWRVRKDGSRFWSKVVITAMRNEKGELRGFSKVTRDITERKLAEEALQQKEERLRLALDAAHFGTWDWHIPSGQIVWNQEHYRLMGYQPGSMPPSYDAWAGRLYPEDRAAAELRLREAMERGGDYAMEYRSLRPDGTIRHLEALGRFERDPEGNAVRSYGVLRDITERKRALQKIEAALKNEIVLRREIHHRVKNNLQIVISLLYLQAAEISDPGAREILRECQLRTHSIALIYALLSGSENLTRIEFAEYARQLTADLLAAYQIKQERIALTIDAKGIFICIDTALPCGLIMTELVTNSLKHAFPDARKGQIAVKLCSIPGGFLELTVQDNGVGLPEGFNPETTHTMGIRLVRDLSRQVQGALKFQSDHGVAVTIAFPERGCGLIR